MKYARYAPHLLLAVMAAAMVHAAWHDSATMDEAAHIPAGYSYVVKRDMRLNPEHPPLIKTLAGLSAWALAKPINFPDEIPAWKENINDQWSFGFHFLYGAGNDAEKIIYAARLAAILLALILGWFIWLWAQDLIGSQWALMPLAVYALSPNFIAHGHLVTTDIGAALGVLASLYFFDKYLKNQTLKNLFFAGLGLGFGLLLKFTVVFVVPVLIFMAALYALASGGIKTFFAMIGKLALMGFVAGGIVTLVYVFHVWDYPAERQFRDANFILASYGFRPAVNLTLWLTRENVAFRAIGQYLFGLLMNLQRAAGGNTTYFLGEISASGWRYYFPIVYLIKEPLPILILLAIAGAIALKRFRPARFFDKTWLKETIRSRIAEIGMLTFIASFWTASIMSHLNIGVRHIFPTLPLLYILAAGQIKNWQLARRPKTAVVATLIGWLALELAFIAPNYIAYFNEFAGGPQNAGLYVADSNLDWGQDLKRLRDFVVKNNIPKIKVDYFGGGDAAYYLGERYEPMARGVPQKGWLAVSVTFLDGGIGRPAKGHRDECCYYRWLEHYQPVAKIGYSIYVYNISD